MKLTALLIAVMCFQVSAKVFSQEVSISVENASIEKVLQEIRKQSGYTFFYNARYLKKAEPVTMKVEKASLEEALKSCFSGQPFTYEIIGNAIVIKKIEEHRVPAPVPITISGKVTDEKGQPLAGVSIMVKGTAVAAASDDQGGYTITAPDTDRILLFSYIGYVTREISIQGRTTINVQLTPQLQSLDEIVVVGYGTVRKQDLTGSVNSLKAEDIQSGVQVSVDQMIKGRAPGVQITSTSSEPGGGASVRIRGANSINASNEPLYVIDGLPITNEPAPGSGVANMPAARNPLNALNPGDIASIEILKDASATAIYGSRGANGVVLITTKRGKEGKMKVNYSAYGGTQQVARHLDLLNGGEYMTFQNDLLQDQGKPAAYTQAEIDEVGAGTDWQSEVFRTAPVQSHQLSFSGGSENTQYYVSLNYMDQQGVVISSGMKRYAAKINLNHSYKKFNFGLNLNTSLIKDDYVANGLGFNADAGVIATAIQMFPMLPVYDGDGNYAESSIIDLDNPAAIANTIYDDAKTNRTFGSIFAEYSIADGLKAKLNFGSDQQNSRRDGYISKVTKRGQRTNASAAINEQERSNYLVELTLNYTKDFNNIHHINAVGGYTYQEFNGRGFNAGSQNFPTDAYLTNDLNAGDKEKFSIGSGMYKNQLLSYLGRVNYSLLNKYLLTASFRVDGSSRFGENNKYGYFPSAAIAWKLAEEPFIAGLNTFSDLKLRASYGVTGNQEIGNYLSRVLLDVSGRAVFDEVQVVGIAPVRLENPDLRWETTKQFNAGLDFAILKDRISGSVDYFEKRTSDLLLNLQIPFTSGFGVSLQNIGNTKNNGFEFVIDSKNITGKINWSTVLSGATIRNKVTSLGPLDEITQGGLRFIDDFTILREGFPINSYYGYKVEGIFRTTEEIAASAQKAAKPGDIRFTDINDDGAITAADRTILGDPFPDFSLGLGNSLSYAGFDLDLFMEGVYGNDMLNFTRIDSESPIEAIRNRMDFVLDRWTPDNPDSRNPSFVTNSGRPVNSRVIEDASYLRLKNVRLSYNFPHLKSKAVSSLSVFASAQNLFTITDYSGFDPDVSAYGDSNIKLDYNAYPLSKIYTFGINIGL